MACRIIQDLDACIGCGSCAAVCPENWVMKEDKGVPKSTKVKDVSCNQEAADACPVQCIMIEDLSD
ncbi:MAG: ferredoxin [archaeon]